MSFDEYMDKFLEPSKTREEGRQEGLREGRREGRLKGEQFLQNVIVSVAIQRFKSLPMPLSIFDKIRCIHRPQALNSLLISLALLDMRETPDTFVRLVESNLEQQVLEDAIVSVAQARFGLVPESLLEKIRCIHEIQILSSLLVSTASLDKEKGLDTFKRMVESSLQQQTPQ